MSYLMNTAPVDETPMDVVQSGNIPAIVRRIEEAVEAETAAIRTDVNFDIKASNARKSRYLYELNRATRGLDVARLGPETRTSLSRLREKLEINEQAILAHMNAVREVATMLQNAIQHAENDGTYSAQQFGKA
jgi:glutamine synthetase type III